MAETIDITSIHGFSGLRRGVEAMPGKGSGLSDCVDGIAREQSVRFAVGLMARQAIAAIVFSMLLAWGGAVLVMKS